MNVLFLDFDEVFLTVRSRYNVDPIAANLIRELCCKYELSIVVISSHRLLGEKHCKEVLTEAGLWEYAYVNDLFTGDFEYTEYCRGLEVLDWVKRHGIVNYLIIDDGHDFLPEQDDKIVHPDMEDGMLFKHFLQSCSICDKFVTTK